MSIAALADMRGDVVALDGEVSNSTHSEDFREAHPDRYFEMFIAEQQLVAAAVGMQVRGWTPYVSTFSAFLSRAYDFVRMARDLARQPDAVGLARRRLDRRGRPVADGARGHRLDPRDPRLDRPAPERRQPDGEARRRCWPTARASRSSARCGPRRPVRTAPDEDVSIGGSRIAHEGSDVAIIACGITLDEAVKAAERLAEGGIHARVLDAYSIKPIDAEAVRAAARDCGAIVTVEDHAPEGGLGDAVLEALAEGDERAHVVKLAVREIPGSGTPAELLHGAKIDADAIADAAQKLVAAPA